ncbi:MAG: glycine cleavage system protein GcvH [Phreatobacter sp.]|nr:glycine cleavage system protein GcvH [Phreatobacter sp.]
MATVKYTKDHEYIRVDGDTGTVGISHYAQEQLGDVVFVELPAAGKAVKKGDSAAVVESVKAASDIYSPVSGQVVEANPDLEGAPATVNDDPAGKGWFFKVKIANTAELDDLMDEAAYKAYLDTL